MRVFFEIVLCFLALCGASYLLRDAYRLWACRRLRRVHFVLVARASSFCCPKERERALLLLSAFLSRPEARHLVREVFLTDEAASPKEIGEAAENFGLCLSVLDEAELIRRL